MASKKSQKDHELTEVRPTGESRNTWIHETASKNINKSIRSIGSTTSFDQSTRSITSRRGRLRHSRKDSFSSKRSNPSNDRETAYDQWFGVSGASFFLNTSINTHGVLGSLRPQEGLPQIDSIPSSIGQGSQIDDGENSDDDTSSTASDQTVKDLNLTTTSYNQSPSDMAGSRAEDFGNTFRTTVESNPDYDFVGDGGKGLPPSANLSNGSDAKMKQDSKPTGKKMAGAIRLPISASSAGSKSELMDDYSQPQKNEKKMKRQTTEYKPYEESTPPEDVKDLSKLANLGEETINKCLKARYQKDLIYTQCGEIMISVNPFKDIGIYTKKEMEAYNYIAISDEPHLYMISAKAYQGLKIRQTDQVILVSGESGAGKTEATKLLVQHVIDMAGSDEPSIQDKIIQVNPLLENFGNAKTVLNNNSSRFAKFLRLNFSNDAVVQSAKVQDFMLEKSRVIHYQDGETTYHSFYALLAGHDNPSSLYINPGEMFRITGNFSSTRSRTARAYKERYDQQQKVFQLLEMKKEEREDVDIILAAILHIGDIQFQDDVHDSVTIDNEDTVQKVANLLDLDNEELTKALIERRGRVGKGEFIQFSKKKRQADDERDALAKALYERLFGWIVRKINDALIPQHGSHGGSIGLLDICGFEDVGANTFEQLCINIINEHLQNFMNNKVIKDEKELYEQEGIPLGEIDVAGVSSDAVLAMFTKKNGILDSIDEDSKIEVVSNDVKMVRKLDALLKENDKYIPATSNRPEFTIRHFAGEVKYDGTSFIKKNCDNLGELVEECLKNSKSALVNDLFQVKPSYTGSISMSQYQFQGSKRGGGSVYKPLMGNMNLSHSINKSTRVSLHSRFGTKLPSFKSDLSSKKTHIYYFKNSLDQLNRSMQTAIPYFVRCIKPNDFLKAGRYDTPRVLPQLKYNGITEIARIRSCGLPIRIVKKDFLQRYGDLAPVQSDENDHVASILQSANAPSNTYKIGISQVFTTRQVQSFLDDDLTDLRRRQEEERRRKEEERKRKEEERKRREAEEKERQKQLFLAEKRQKELAEKQMRDIEERQRKKEAEIERLTREKEELKRREEEEERWSVTQKLRSDLMKMKSFNPDFNSQRHLSAFGGTAGVGFMDDIEEVPTPASQYDSSVYNRITREGSQSSFGLSQLDIPIDKPSDPFVTVKRDVQDQDVVEDESDDDIISVDDYTEWVDHFQVLTEEEAREDLSDLRALKVIKVIIYIFLALMLLISLVVQKVSVVTLIMELKDPENPPKDPKAKTRQTAAVFMLVLVLCIPYAVGFLLSFLKLLFGISKGPSLFTWIWVMCVECIHSVGLCVLVFRVLPQLDIFRIVYAMSATACIPSLLKFFISDRIETKSLEKKRNLSSCGYKTREAFGVLFDFLAFAVQSSAVAAIVYLDFYWKNSKSDGPDTLEIVVLVAGLVLASVNKWENFADGTLLGFELNEKSWFKNKILKLRFELQESRNYPNTLASFVKIPITILAAYLLTEIRPDYGQFVDILTYDPDIYSWKFFVPVAAATTSAFIAFNTSLMALKLQMQRFSFALPLCLCTPATVAVLYLDCSHPFLDVVSMPLSAGLNESCSERLMWGQIYHLVLFGGAWLVSLLVVCRHIWRKQQDKNSDMNRLFLDPYYCGILTTEHIMMNQRRHQNYIDEMKELEGNDIRARPSLYEINRLVTFSSHGTDGEDNAAFEAIPGDENGIPPGVNKDGEDGRKHVTPKIYACATMWHETRTEMVQLLKSLHRLDFDQYLRKFRKESNRRDYDPHYYEFEAHIFFDDAMEKDDDDFPVPNRWVKDLVGAMSEACSSVHCKPMVVLPPVKLVTPYGGQLVWTMPGENLLFVHLKDMDKIRNRKRWSQVMYMYYLLNYRLGMFCKEEAVKQMEEKNRKNDSQGLNIQELNIMLGKEYAARADKTFILALDGDTDFLPASIRMLMERMDVETVGATCGRIHPIGNGPMIWYQKFEYAVGHWLQKASEHVFGCVLCSPGCFSLFRARALMDANVVKRYTTEPTEPSHHLQYDQGEDRWLCTLLLQRGYRIEYAAGADAWTFAPEGFFEFFNQRRRWMPSTIANILDLLGSADRTRRDNPNISLPYIIYTWLLMLMTLLGPGTILMMMAGAFQLIFTLEITWAYFWSILPAGVFTVACFWLKTKWQLLLAAALSIGYGFIMVIVIVGTIITATTENIFHPSVIIMVGLLGIFIVTGLFHPKEAACLIHGVLYILCIPSGYLLLVIYSICNLNDVSWGTREVPTKAQRLANEEKNRRKEEEKLAKGKKSFFKRIFDSSESHITELTNLLRTVIPRQSNMTDAQINQLVNNPQDENNMVKILADIAENTRLTRELLEGKRPQGVTSQPAQLLSVPGSQAVPEQQGASAPSTSGKKSSLKKRRKIYSKLEDPSIPRWTQDAGIGKGRILQTNSEEMKFWSGMIDRYLKPIRPPAADKKKIADGLKDLRNSSAFAFILVNLLWMSLNFMFQLTEAAKVHLTYSFGKSKYDVEESVLGMSFVILLLVLLLLQFAGMVIHRMGTLQQLLADTKIWGTSDDQKINHAADEEAAIRNIKAALQVPAPNDNFQTPQPVAANENNLAGISVRPVITPIAQDLNKIAKTVKMFGSMVNAERAQTLKEGKDTVILDEVKKELAGSQQGDRIGTSYRPNLPPRKGLARKDSREKWLTRQGNIGMTAKELKKWRPDDTIVSESAVDKANAQFGAMGAIGKSLNLRASAYNKMKSTVDANWTTDDVAGNARRQSVRMPSRAYSQRMNNEPRVSFSPSPSTSYDTTRM